MRKQLEIELSSNPALQRLEVVFGPHFRLVVLQEGAKASIELVATHHGVKLDASQIGGELERALEMLREAFPERLVD